jgi:DNA-binding NarL/FixJ family response regulator
MSYLHLTDHELRLVAQLAQGKNHDEVGAALGISKKAVGSRLHVVRIRAGYRTTAQLMFRLGQESARGSKEI